MPERESDHLTPATRLLEKRREMTEVELALATQKEVGITCTIVKLLTILLYIQPSSVNIKFYIHCIGISDEDGNTAAEKR